MTDVAFGESMAVGLEKSPVLWPVRVPSAFQPRGCPAGHVFRKKRIFSAKMMKNGQKTSKKRHFLPFFSKKGHFSSKIDHFHGFRPAMRRWGRRAWALGVGTALAAGLASAAQPEEWLGRVDTQGSIASFPLPIYSQGRDAAGQEYVLVKATAAEWDRSGLSYQVLDVRAESATYILAHAFRPGARAAAQGRFHVVHDDGADLIIRASAGEEVAALADLGFQCRFLEPAPLRFFSPRATIDPAVYVYKARIPDWPMATLRYQGDPRQVVRLGLPLAVGVASRRDPSNASIGSPDAILHTKWSSRPQRLLDSRSDEFAVVPMDHV